ncbi:Uncharacterised protein [Mycoplasmopsis citelli]|uniref:Uncharacterized protein n=1 Tax=Mycoplasmopsis citelli TaxID=171281 RepID=A0A449B2C6_9BACT|nr:hypothetical protein [Mycoplasmopsis citelli]VEU74748.1 Uncharacterised protein [Mycoplasmopsis citelli]
MKTNKEQFIDILEKFNQIAKEMGFVYSIDKNTYNHILSGIWNLNEISFILYLDDFIKIVASNKYLIKYQSPRVLNNPLPHLIINQREIPLSLVVHSNTKILNSSLIKKYLKKLSKQNNPYFFDQILAKMQTEDINVLCHIKFQNYESLVIKEINNVNLKYYDVLKINDKLSIPIHNFFKKEK